MKTVFRQIKGLQKKFGLLCLGVGILSSFSANASEANKINQKRDSFAAIQETLQGLEKNPIAPGCFVHIHRMKTTECLPINEMLSMFRAAYIANDVKLVEQLKDYLAQNKEKFSFVYYPVLLLVLSGDEQVLNALKPLEKSKSKDVKGLVSLSKYSVKNGSCPKAYPFEMREVCMFKDSEFNHIRVLKKGK